MFSQLVWGRHVRTLWGRPFFVSFFGCKTRPFFANCVVRQGMGQRCAAARLNLACAPWHPRQFSSSIRTQPTIDVIIRVCRASCRINSLCVNWYQSERNRWSYHWRQGASNAAIWLKSDGLEARFPMDEIWPKQVALGVETQRDLVSSDHLHKFFPDACALHRKANAPSRHWYPQTSAIFFCTYFWRFSFWQRLAEAPPRQISRMNFQSCKPVPLKTSRAQEGNKHIETLSNVLARLHLNHGLPTSVSTTKSFLPNLVWWKWFVVGAAASVFGTSTCSLVTATPK